MRYRLEPSQAAEHLISLLGLSYSEWTALSPTLEKQQKREEMREQMAKTEW